MWKARDDAVSPDPVRVTRHLASDTWGPAVAGTALQRDLLRCPFLLSRAHDQGPAS